MRIIDIQTVELFIALQKLTNRNWEPTELFPKVRLKPDANIVMRKVGDNTVLRRDKFPVWNSIRFSGKNTDYEIDINRKQLVDGQKLPIKLAQIYTSDIYAVDEQEIIDFINWLIGP